LQPAELVPLAMLNATTTNTALKVASGMNRASGAAARMMTRSVAAWTSPEIGVRPPLRTFVAVAQSHPSPESPQTTAENIRESLGHQFLGLDRAGRQSSVRHHGGKQ